MSIADISLLAAIFAGALSFLSPCVLPLVPPYLCYMAGVSVEDFQAERKSDVIARRSILLASFFFTLGFSTVFVALGAGASSIGGLLRAHMDVLAQIAGVVIIIMGLHFLGVFRIGLLAREARFQGGGTPATVTGAYIMGLAFAFGWTPCIGPVLGAILGVAGSRDTVGDGAVLLAAYSLGLAVPFWIAAGFSGMFMRFLMRFRRHLGLVEKIMGGLLVLTGILFLTGGMQRMAFWLLETFPVFATIG
ncbi:cytochrome c biogenesis CcdA family protein [Hoeflea prorocentri]|uniref:Cytochrome c biogenesis CcdA family protein n=1 Tax=Hoeflea prorocentri TaxID=1922333 RepID=A0A9X3UG95_9HYPH|nr:cytochrome c biogenesis CcdA family protein [Hoeflea prorocentri]MCY6380793.1 cytochrome c biogenesis CcdA family protein [Hoeflea prorocentri]MDA5398593.1 cytochrome c biogenesis CcdA family protein [Hoeflea prorocentri]